MGSTSLLWALGLVGVVFGIANFVVGLFGAGFDRFWIGTNLVLGLALLVVAAVSNLEALRERMSSGEARRAGKYGTSALVGTALMLLIIASLGFLGTRYHHRFDWSENKVHSLTSQSEQVLENLEADVEVVALFSPLDMPPIRELLDLYAYTSPRFVVTYADPNERPELLERHGIGRDQLGAGIVRVALGGESVLVDEPIEEKITNAIVKLSRSGEKKVYFLEGHNERAVAGEAAAERDGFERAAEALRNENYAVDSLLLAALGEVPDDADVVVVAGATRPFLEAERTALERYLAGGGALMVLVDPRANTDLVENVRAWGVDLGEDVIVDQMRALFGQPTSPFAAQYGDHDITREMREPALFHVARSVRKGEGSDFTEIVSTAETSWAERDLERFYDSSEAEFDEGMDLRGPVSLAVAGTPVLSPNGEGGEDASAASAAEARLVVFGDTDFAANELVEAYRNRDLFVNSVNWLMGDVEAISIRPTLSRASRFALSAQDFMRIRTLSLFVLPQAIAIVGVFVWWSRRRTPER